METFKNWYNENKDSEILKIEYIESVYDLPKKDRPSFKAWCKEYYNHLFNL